MNYLVIHKSSNLITGAITTSFKPKNSTTHKLIKVSDTVLDKYYALKDKLSPSQCVDAGELAKLSPSFYEALGGVGEYQEVSYTPRSRTAIAKAKAKLSI